MRALLALALALAGPAETGAETTPAGPGPGALCRAAAADAAARHGVPERLMQTIALAETGRRRGGRLTPWPWALNIAGTGVWAASRADARARAEAAIAAGERSVDIGCFQLNWRWHGHHFASVDAMLEPARAADHAARFLRRLRAEAGDWDTAAGHYHSRTPRHARRYRARLARLGAIPDAASGRADTGAAPPAAAAAPAARRARPAAATIRFARTTGRGGATGVGGGLLAAASGPLLDTARGPLLPRGGRAPLVRGAAPQTGQ